jgi:hypothetical protein
MIATVFYSTWFSLDSPFDYIKWQLYGPISEGLNPNPGDWGAYMTSKTLNRYNSTTP